MLSIERHIAYLVTRHDCVIVPGLGAFISLYTSAKYDESSDSFTPPARMVSFNADINHNDAMLAASVARREDMSYDRAAELVQSEVDSWRRQLDSSGELAIEGVGTLSSSGDGYLHFMPSAVGAATNSLFYGLPTLDRLLPVAAKAEDEPHPEKVTGKIHRISNHVIRAAASVAIIVTIIATMFTAALKPDSPLYYASLFPSTATAPEPTAGLTDRPIVQPYNAELRIAMVPQTVGTITNTVERKAVATPSTPSHRYFLIVASLANEREAQKYLSSLPQEQRNTLRILPGNGRHRVYVASGSTFSEANSARSVGNNATLYPDAWVYVKQ